MKLKERRPYLIMEKFRELLLDSEKDIGVLINPVQFFYVPLGNGQFTMEECGYVTRLLLQKEYLDYYIKSNPNENEVKLTVKGFEEWIFPGGQEITNKIFLSHSSADKGLAGKLKKALETDFSVFLAHDDIPGTAKWRDRILSEMETAAIFLALRTPNYKEAQYTEQECGFALAKKKRILCVCIGTKTDKMGFCGEYQGVSFKTEDVQEIAKYCKDQFQ